MIFLWGGGQKLERVGFSAKNGDRYGDSALITTQGKSLESPCEAPFLARKSHREQLSLESTFTQHKPFSSTILESQSSSESHKTRRSRSFFSKSHRERLSLESTFSHNAPFLSSRADEVGVAIHKGAQADSKKNTQKATPLESTFEKTQMDCHADFQSARNDRKNATFQKVDSSTATNVSEPQNKRAESAFDKRVAGGRIFLKKLRFACFDEKAGLCSLLCGDKTDGLSHKQKASSPLYRKKPTPNDSKNCGGAGVALHTFGGRSYLGGNDYPPNVCNQSHCLPKTESPKGKVVAIDSIYTTLTPTTTYPNITLEPDLFHALDRYEFDLFFASDVLHHLSPDFTQKLLESIAHIPIIIIKDIDSRHIFGHYANALHDLVFNQEKVCKIYPNKLESTLQALGYTTRYHYLPKLWYPHFLLLAYKPDYRHLLKDNDER